MYDACQRLRPGPNMSLDEVLLGSYTAGHMFTRGMRIDIIHPEAYISLFHRGLSVF